MGRSSKRTAALHKNTKENRKAKPGELSAGVPFVAEYITVERCPLSEHESIHSKCIGKFVAQPVAPFLVSNTVDFV